MPDSPFGGIKLELIVSSGIPEAYSATLKYLTVLRETTDQDIRRRSDLMGIWAAEQFLGLFGYVPPTS